MATLSRSKSSNPNYKEYMSFLDTYKKEPSPPKTLRSEIFIEIQPNPKSTSVSEVSKMFENKPPIQTKPILYSTTRVSPQKFQAEIVKRPQTSYSISAPSQKPAVPTSPPLVMPTAQKIVMPIAQKHIPPPPPPPMMPTTHNSAYSISVPSQKPVVPTPPPPMMPTTQKSTNSVRGPQIQAHFTKGAPTTHIVQNNTGFDANAIDKSHPIVNKLVYGSLRNLYKSYNGKANEMVDGLPQYMVKKDNGIQNIIEQMAANGDLTKLSGRANPKKDNE